MPASEGVGERDLGLQRADAPIGFLKCQVPRVLFRLVGFLAQAFQPQGLRTGHLRAQTLLHATVFYRRRSHVGPRRFDFPLDYMFPFCSNKAWTTELMKSAAKSACYGLRCSSLKSSSAVRSAMISVARKPRAGSSPCAGSWSD